MFCSIAVTLASTLAPFPCAIQETEHISPEFRQQLGQRVIRMEHAFEVASEERRQSCVNVLVDTVQDFFSARFQSAAEGLDTATALLQDRDGPHWSDALAFTCDPWLEEKGETCRVSIAQFYAADIPTTAQLRVVGEETWQELGPLPRTLALNPEFARSTQLTEADVHLTWTIEIREGTSQPERSEEFRFSRAQDFRSRARKVQSVERSWRDAGRSWRSETARLHLELLFALYQGEQQEIWLDGARLLQAAERLVSWLPNDATQAAPSMTDWINATPQLAGKHLVAWPSGIDGGRHISRIQFPFANHEESKLPTVIALHGSGGTENMFFSSYGAGKITGLARDHEFLLLSPRVPNNMDLTAYINEAAKHLPIDTNRIYVVGHSMGAGVAQRRLYSESANFRAAALVGGGRPSDRTLPAEHPAIWLAAGDEDFARGGLNELHTQLKESGLDVTYKVYPNCEHLAVMQVALPDVFEWFKKLDDADRVSKNGD